MKTTPSLTPTWSMGALILAGVLCGSPLLAEQSLETLLVFNGENGAHPSSLVQLPNGTFYGTTTSGGAHDLGTIFKIPLDQPLVTVVTFDGINGTEPSSRMVLSLDGNLYGTTHGGGANGLGTIYRISPEGKFETLASFDGTHGSIPQADLVITESGKIYGCTDKGGINDQGTIFVVGPHGRIETLASFSGTNGSYPQGLALGSDGALHGTTRAGGAHDLGTLFSIDLGGTFTSVYSFHGAEGANPHGHLAQMTGDLYYGTTSSGGDSNMGTIYSLSPQGVITNIHSCCDYTGSHPGPDLVEWSNGFFFMQSLYSNMWVKTVGTQWRGTNLFGTTLEGGEHGNGTIFRITEGGELSTMIAFTGNEGTHPGSSPNSLMPGSDGNLYGTTELGGMHNKGTIFRLMMPAWRATGSYQPLPAGGLPQPALPPIVSR